MEAKKEDHEKSSIRHEKDPEMYFIASPKRQMEHGDHHPDFYNHTPLVMSPQKRRPQTTQSD